MNEFDPIVELSKEGFVPDAVEIASSAHQDELPDVAELDTAKALVQSIDASILTQVESELCGLKEVLQYCDDCVTSQLDQFLGNCIEPLTKIDERIGKQLDGIGATAVEAANGCAGGLPLGWNDPANWAATLNPEELAVAQAAEYFTGYPATAPQDAQGRTLCTRITYVDPCDPQHVGVVWGLWYNGPGQPLMECCPGPPGSAAVRDPFFNPDCGVPQSPPPPPGPPPPPPPGPGDTCEPCPAPNVFTPLEGGGFKCEPPPPDCPPCEPPPGPPEGPPKEEPKPAEVGKRPSYCDVDSAKTVKKMLDVFGGMAGVDPKDWQGFSAAIGAKDSKSGPADKPPGLVAKIAKTGIDWAVDTALNVAINGPLGAVGIEDADSCNRSGFLKSAVGAGIINFIDKWTDLVPPQVTLNWQYTTNYFCQYIIPSAGELSQAWTRGYINDDQWELGTKLNGVCLPWEKKVREARFNRITVQDALRLFRLEKIDREEFEKRVRNAGWDWKADRDAIEDAYDQYPPFGDLIRMMQRDVADDGPGGAVEQGKLDQDFPVKWQGQLKQWGFAQGVSDDIAKAYWRAHWQLPSPTQGYEFLHRLRPDDRDPNDPFRDLTFSRQRLESLLKQADYAPGFVSEMIAVSYRPLTRVDTRRMYEEGVLDYDGVRRAYRDLGYDEQNARRLADFTKKLGDPKRNLRSGSMPAAEVLKLYADQLLSRPDAEQLLRSAGVNDESIPGQLDLAELRSAVKRKSRSRDALKRRYFLGEFDQASIVPELAGAGFDSGQAVQIAQVWAEELRARRREPTLAMLCGWHGRGIINGDELMRRVRNLRYSEEDALRAVEHCVSGIRERQFNELVKQQKEAEKRQKERDREERRRRKEFEPCRSVKPLCPGSRTRTITHTESTEAKINGVKVTDSDSTRIAGP